MNTQWINERRCPRTTGWRPYAASMALLAAVALPGCGGGDGGTPGSSSAASAEAGLAPRATEVVAVDADVRQKVYVTGSAQGFVARSLAASMPAGTEGSYDILVIGDADQGGAAVLEQARKALADGKEVVLDAASDGSAQPAHAKTLQALVGTRIDAGAVRVQKGDSGYYVTPIDFPQVALKKLQIAQAKAQPQFQHPGDTPSSNSVQNVFGIQSKEPVQ